MVMIIKLSVIESGTYTSEQVQNKLINATIFKLNEDNTWEDYTYPSKTKTTYYKNSYQYYTYYEGPVAVDTTIGTIIGYNSGGGSAITLRGNLYEDGLYAKISIKPTADHIATTTIPGHYEDAMEPPYLIMDTYKRIKLSPWFVSCTSSSLEGAITKAKILVEMLGIENVKLIKIVPFDQFIKIK